VTIVTNSAKNGHVAGNIPWLKEKRFTALSWHQQPRLAELYFLYLPRVLARFTACLTIFPVRGAPFLCPGIISFQ
jgi:hypothetical protein